MRTVYLIKEIEWMPGFVRGDNGYLTMTPKISWRGPNWVDIVTPEGKTMYIPNCHVLYIDVKEENEWEDKDDRE